MEHERVLSAVAAAAASVSTSLVTQISVWFGVPPPTRRQVLRGICETVIGVPLAVIFGYGFGEPVAGILTGMVGWATHDKVAIDGLAGGLVVGTVVLRVVPLLAEVAEAHVRKKFAPGSDA